MIISSVSCKGGVGKTSLVVNLATLLTDKKVLCLDLCGNSDVATRLGFDRREFNYDSFGWLTGEHSFEQSVYTFNEQVDFIPSSDRIENLVETVEKKNLLNPIYTIKEKLEQIKHLYDVILIDNHPSEDKRLTMSLVASSLALIPITIDRSSIEGGERVIDYIEQINRQGMNLAYCMVPMSVDLNKGYQKELNMIVADMSNIRFLTPIRYSSVVHRFSLANQLLVENQDNRYARNVMDDYLCLIEAGGLNK